MKYKIMDGNDVESAYKEYAKQCDEAVAALTQSEKNVALFNYYVQVVHLSDFERQWLKFQEAVRDFWLAFYESHPLGRLCVWLVDWLDDKLDPQRREKGRKK